MKTTIFTLSLLMCPLFLIPGVRAEGRIKEPNVAGQFYPAEKEVLGQMIDGFIEKTNPPEIKGDIFALISPHAGYPFSGATAAFGYKLVKGRPYKTVVVIGPAHFFGFDGVSVYASGKFRTPLGDLEIDTDFTNKLINPDRRIGFVPQAFDREHSVEVQLPFLQRVLSNFRIVPVVVGDADIRTLEGFADNLVKAIGNRKDVLVIVSSDLCHSYDYQVTEDTDKVTLSVLGSMSGQGFYTALRQGKVQMCGGFPAVVGLIAGKKMGYENVKILSNTNTALVTGQKVKGAWTVGYASGVIGNIK